MRKSVFDGDCETAVLFFLADIIIYKCTSLQIEIVKLANSEGSSGESSDKEESKFSN